MKKEGKKWDSAETILVLTNGIPIVGVMFFDWSIMLILFAYWLESGVIGFFTVIKMIISKNKSFYNIDEISGRHEPLSSLKSIIMKISLIPFFIIHYGGFMLGHLVLIFGISAMTGEPFPSILSFTIQIIIIDASLFISHGISFYKYSIKEREYEKTLVPILMMAPYGRIVIMHLSLLIGAFIIVFLGAPQILISFFIILKTAIDLRAHRKEHNIK